MYPKVSIIILNWNGLEDTAECLESLKKITYPNYKVIVVDNASSGDDVKVLRERFGDYIHIIQNDANYGFAEGNNIGMRYALTNCKLDYFLILNNDTVVAPGFLTELVKAAESDPHIAILGPKIFYYDFKGRKDVIWFAGGAVHWWRPAILQRLYTDDSSVQGPSGPVTIDWVTGSAMMIRSSIIEQISLFDSRYFFGNEDVDYCLKARRHGLTVVYVPTAVIWHKVGASRKKWDPGFANLAPHYRLIRQNAPTLARMYHLMLMPFILLQWGLAFLTRHRDKETLTRFIFNIKRLILR